MKPAADNEAATAALTPFPFSKLPPETQLRVLEHTDLVSPTRHYTWNSENGFMRPQNVKRGSWRSPQSCFLVSRDFYTKAREVFWKRNIFTVVPDAAPFFLPKKPAVPSNMPTRYAACQFLNEHVPAQSLPYLRSLRLRIFGKVDESAVEEARERWFQTINYAVGHGLSLSSLHVHASLDKEEWRALETTLDDEELRILRTSIIENVWPISMESAPRAISDDFLVECRGETKRWRYGLRRECQETEESHSDPKFESPLVQHRLSLKDDAGGEARDWVEEFRFEKVKRTEF